MKIFVKFLSRFFANKGYLDGLHGLSLSLLQAFSFIIVYLKLWQKYKFEEQKIEISELEEESRKAGDDIKYWFLQTKLSKSIIKNLIQKIKYKL